MSKYILLRLRLRLRLSLIVILSTVALSAQADEESAFAETARLRTYIGGADESDLKVQPELNSRQGNKQNKHTQSAPEPVDGF